jgi:hypothetical protein
MKNGDTWGTSHLLFALNGLCMSSSQDCGLDFRGYCLYMVLAVVLF